MLTTHTHTLTTPVASLSPRPLRARTLKHCYNYTLGWFLPNYDMSKEEVCVSE